MIEERSTPSRPVGILSVIAIFIFFTMILATGGLYFYKGTAQKQLAQKEADLNLAKNRFEPSKIVQMQLLDKRLRASTEILGKHIAITPIFNMLEELTMKTVRYTKFTYSLDNSTNSRVSFKINGQAIGYRSIALQSDLFTKNKQILDPVFSDLTLDDKGNVLFTLSFSVDPSFVDYRQMINKERASLESPVTPTPASVIPVETTPTPAATQTSTPGMVPTTIIPPITNTN